MTYDVANARPDEWAKLMSALVDGSSIAAASRDTGVPIATAHRWTQRPEFQEEFKERLVSRMGYHLPELVGEMMVRAKNPKTGLLPIAKTFQVLADKAGFADAQTNQDTRQHGLQISINLDAEPSGEKSKDAQIADLENQLAELRGQLVNGTAQEVTDG
ncbi:hypothetical protein [Tateyamaria sp.]|uniref:hypothetical protein n=1 Tax=Tateyamaria sp. TaxID=1929288 RepID=UPI00329C70FB